MDVEAILSAHAKQVEPGVYVLNGASAHTIVCKSANTDTIAIWFNQFYAKFKQVSNSDEEPMLNLLAWMQNGHYYLVVYPRKMHRPSQFFAEGDANILISPASIDLGGIFITPLEKDFSKITDADIKDILQQITVTPDIFNKLIK
jgi:hypothetical protein